MKKRTIDIERLQEFESFLKNEERSEATVEKYMRDIRYFVTFSGVREITKQEVVEYKRRLTEKYAVTSAST